MSNATFRALLRNNLSAFIEKSYLTIDRSQDYIRNWHLEVIADHLEQCAQGEVKRLIINMPPRSLKSVCASVAFPAWLLGKYPDKRIVCVSYSEDLANKHARDCRALMETDWYQSTFPFTKINPHKRSENEFETIGNGYRLATSVGGTLTGRGGSIIIIDDPLKPQDALSEARRSNVNRWYDNTLFSRLDNKETGCIIIVMQRVNIDDLAAHVQTNEEWTILNLPAVAIKPETYLLSNGKVYNRNVGDALNPLLESKQTLDKIKANIGTYNYSAQYQQEPIPEQGNIINWNWFPFYESIPKGKRRDRIIQSWDTAMTAHDGSDYSSCVTIREVDSTYYILDVYRAKLDFPSLKKQIIKMKEEFNAQTVLIEDKGSGTGMMQQLRTEGIQTIAYKPTLSKADRMVAQSAHIESGKVFLPITAKWLDDFRMEVVSFPYSRHDDQIDALSQGLHWLTMRGRSYFDV